MRIDAGDDLAIELEHQTQYPIPIFNSAIS